MIGLPEKVIDEGENLILNGYTQAFENLCEQHMGQYASSTLIKHVQILESHGQRERAVKLWKVVATQWDTDGHRNALLFFGCKALWFGCKALFVMFMIGSIIYLILR